MSPYDYRTMEMVFAILLLIAYHNVHSFSISQRNIASDVNKFDDMKVSESKTQEVQNLRNDSVTKTLDDVELTEVEPATRPVTGVNNIISLTTAVTTLEENTSRKTNWFTLTTKISVEKNKTYNEITTGQNIVTAPTDTFSSEVPTTVITTDFTIALVNSSQNESNSTITATDNIEITTSKYYSSPLDINTASDNTKKANYTGPDQEMTTILVKNLIDENKANSNESQSEYDTFESPSKQTYSPVSSNNVTPRKEYTVIERRKLIPSIDHATAVNKDIVNNEITSTDSFVINGTNYGIIYDSQTEAETKNEVLTFMNGNSAESQIKLVEEAATEQFLKEITETKEQDVLSKKHDIKEDEKLSVQPIATEGRTKTSSIYTVKPTYKRPKKLEIIQPKPFIRDPNDNTWRNESISSLGIVFKANNASKPLTLVLKNKTEVELNNTNNKFLNENIPELKERLEKLSEIRKSKKKRPYGQSKDDYEDIALPVVPTINSVPTYASYDFSSDEGQPMEHTIADDPPSETVTVGSSNDIQHIEETHSIPTTTTEIPTTTFNFFEDFESTVDKVNLLHGNDFKQTTTVNEMVTTNILTTTSSPLRSFPERKPTLQYFPPREKTKTRKYDEKFSTKVYTYTTEPTTTENDNFPISLPPLKPDPSYKVKYVYSQEIPKAPASFSSKVQQNEIKNDGRDFNNAFSIVNNEGRFNKDSFVVRHFTDFSNVPINLKYERHPATETFEARPIKAPTYQNDYQMSYSDDNSEFINYPLLYNSSVVHRTGDGNGRVLASSTAFMKRLYDDVSRQNNDFYNNKNCDPNCEKITVELSPDYELHYYIPEQEEISEAEQKLSTVPYQNLKDIHAIRFFNRDGL